LIKYENIKKKKKNEIKKIIKPNILISLIKYNEKLKKLNKQKKKHY
jgi:hypothetical protein